MQNPVKLMLSLWTIHRRVYVCKTFSLCSSCDVVQIFDSHTLKRFLHFQLWLNHLSRSSSSSRERISSYFTVLKEKSPTAHVHTRFCYCWSRLGLHPSALHLFLYVFKCMLIISIHGKPGVWFFFNGSRGLKQQLHVVMKKAFKF